MEIENNIPIPIKKSDIFFWMKIGQSIVYKPSASPSDYEASRQAMKRAMVSTGFKFTLKRMKDENVCRIWRVK